MGRRRKEQSDWHSKVTSTLLELLTAYRESVRAMQLAGDESAETADRIGRQWVKYLQEKLPPTVQTRISRPDPEELIYPMFFKALDGMPPDAARKVGMIEMFHWLRFREPFAVTLGEYEAGSLKAAKKIHRTWWDFDQWQLGGKYPRAFKVGYHHNYILSSMWGLGLENLNEEELAECFEEYCPCEKGEHDGHALRVQRDRMFRALTKSSLKGR